MKAFIFRGCGLLGVGLGMGFLTGCGTLSYDYVRDPSAEQPLGGGQGWDDEAMPASLIDVEFGDGVQEPRVTKNLPRDAVRAIARPTSAAKAPGE